MRCGRSGKRNPLDSNGGPNQDPWRLHRQQGMRRAGRLTETAKASIAMGRRYEPVVRQRPGCVLGAEKSGMATFGDHSYWALDRWGGPWRREWGDWLESRHRTHPCPYILKHQGEGCDHPQGHGGKPHRQGAPDRWASTSHCPSPGSRQVSL